MELARYGVMVNCIAPTAVTRLTKQFMSDDASADMFDPARVAPFIVWLGSPQSAGVTGRVFGVAGNRVIVEECWVNGPFIEREQKWTAAEFTALIPALVKKARNASDMYGNTKPAEAASS